MSGPSPIQAGFITNGPASATYATPPATGNRLVIFVYGNAAGGGGNAWSCTDTDGNVWYIPSGCSVLSDPTTGGTTAILTCDSAIGSGSPLTFTLAATNGGYAAVSFPTYDFIELSACSIDTHTYAATNGPGAGVANSPLTTGAGNTTTLVYTQNNGQALTPLPSTGWAMVTSGSFTGEDGFHGVLESQGNVSAGSVASFSATNTFGALAFTAWTISFFTPGSLTGTATCSFAAQATFPMMGIASCSFGAVGKVVAIATAASAGQFDEDMVIQSWFDPNLWGIGAWFDEDFIQQATAAGAISGTASASFTAKATATIAAAAACLFTATATPSISATAAAAFTASGNLTGNGALAATASANFTATATPTIKGTSSATFTASATASLSATSSCTFAATGVPSLAGTASCAFNASGVPTIAGTAACAFAATGSATGLALVAGTASCTFTASATPSLGATAACSFAASGTPTVIGTAHCSFAATGVILAGVAGTAPCAFAAFAYPTLTGRLPCAFNASATFQNSIRGTASCAFAVAGTTTVSATASCAFAAQGAIGASAAASGTAACSFAATGVPALVGIAPCSFAATAMPSSPIAGSASCAFDGHNLATSLFGTAACEFLATGSLESVPVPPGLGLISVLQIGDTFAGNGQLIPSFFQGTNVACIGTFFHPVTQVESDPDPGTLIVTLIAPDGSLSTVAPVHQGTGAFSASPYLALPGEYDVRFTAMVGGFHLLFEGQFNSVAPYQGTGVPSVNTWIFVNASQSPYQGLADQPNVAVDLRQGIVSVAFPISPSDGDEFTIKDWFDLSSQGSAGPGQPGGPIGLTAAGGVTFENPSSPGSYGATGAIAAPDGFGGTWKYSLQQNAWTLKTQG